MEGAEQAGPATSALEGQVVEVASWIHSLPCLVQGAQEPGQGSDPVPAVWRVTGAGTGPGTKVSLADLCEVMTVSSICKAPTTHLPSVCHCTLGLGFHNGHGR